IAIEDVLAAPQPWRTTRDHYTLIETRTRFRHRSRLQIKVDVVGDKQIEMAVTVVIDKGAASIPARCLLPEAGFDGHIAKGSVAVIVVEGVLPVIADEQVIVPIVVIIADTN